VPLPVGDMNPHVTHGLLALLNRLTVCSAVLHDTSCAQHTADQASLYIGNVQAGDAAFTPNLLSDYQQHCVPITLLKISSRSDDPTTRCP